MIRGWLRASALIAAVAAWFGPAPGAAAEELRFAAATRCAAPAALAAISTPLPQVEARIRAGRPLKIVAIGSSSTQGWGASRPEFAYPARLEAELRRRLPGLQVSVLNRGVGGEEAGQMLERFDRDVVAEAPQLAIWQLGSNGALRRHGVPGMATALGAGVAKLKSRAIDLVLMNAQYAPKMLESPLLGQYLMAVAQIARAEQIGLFSRFAVMRGWVDSGSMTVGEPLIADGLHLNDLGYGCVAEVLAAAILAAANVRLEEDRQAGDARQPHRQADDPPRNDDAGPPAAGGRVAHGQAGLARNGPHGGPQVTVPNSR